MGAYYSRAGSYSRSYNAEVAEDEGRCPLARAKAVVAAEYGCTQVVAAASLGLLHDGEWHHVGKYAAQVAYYDATDCRLGGVIQHILACGGAKKWAARRDEVRADRRYGGKFSAPLESRSNGRILRMVAAKLRQAEAERACRRRRIIDAACKWAHGVVYALADDGTSPREQATKIVKAAVALRLKGELPPRGRHDSKNETGLRLYHAREVAGISRAGINRAVADLLAGKITWRLAVTGQA